MVMVLVWDCCVDLVLSYWYDECVNVFVVVDEVSWVVVVEVWWGCCFVVC